MSVIFFTLSVILLIASQAFSVNLLKRDMKDLLNAMAAIQERSSKHHSDIDQRLATLVKANAEVKLETSIAHLISRFESERKLILDIQSVNPDHVFIRSPK